MLGMSITLLPGCNRSSDEKPEEKVSAEETAGQTEEVNEEEEAKKKEWEELTNWVREAVEKICQKEKVKYDFYRETDRLSVYR